MKIPPWLMAILRSSPVILIASATRLLLVANYDPVVATKIASSSGLAGTLLGTLIPLLPVYLPLVVVALIVVRRPWLALIAIGAMILVTPARVPLNQWWQGARIWLLRAWRWVEHPHGPIWSPLGHGLLVLVHDQWPLWFGGAACVFAVLSAPSRLRHVGGDDLKKQIEQQIKDFSDGWIDRIKVGRGRYTWQDPDDFNRGWLMRTVRASSHH